MKRKQFLQGLGLLVLLTCLGLAILLFTSETLRQRAVAAPRYMRTYLSRWQPTVAAPTPPPFSLVSRDELLAPASTAHAIANPLATPSPPATFTPVPATTSTMEPSATPQPSATTTATTIPLTPIASEVALEGVVYAWQMWNNCGPTTIAMNLSYYGLEFHQRESASVLKPNQDDKNVSPHELADYARSRGFATMTRMGGNVALLKELLSNGFPVIVETWLDPEDHGGLGHYRLFTGYNSAGSYFLAQDSLKGPDVQVAIEEFDRFWRVFNRTYIVVYLPEQEAQLQALLGPVADNETMLWEAMRVAQEEASAGDTDPYAWFNLGTSYMRLGEADRAAAAFDEARRIGLPYRMLWYQFDIFEAYLQVGRYQEVIDLASATIRGANGLEEAYYYRALAQLALENRSAAIDDLREALAYNANFQLATELLTQLGVSE